MLQSTRKSIIFLLVFGIIVCAIGVAIYPGAWPFLKALPGEIWRVLKQYHD